MISQVYFVSVCTIIVCLIMLALVNESTSLDEIRLTDDEGNDVVPLFAPFGTLHTLEKLSYWANKEEDIMEILDKKLKMVEEEITIIEEYFKDYEESSARALAEAHEEVDNPAKIISSNAVLSHLMTNRYTSWIQRYRDLLNSSDYEDFEEGSRRILEIKPHNVSKTWPGSEDLFVSHRAILHIQEAYHLRAHEFYKGPSYNTTHGGQFQAYHCAQLGISALELDYYSTAIDWLELSHRLLLEDENDDTISEELVRTMLDLAVQKHNLDLEMGSYEVLSQSFIYPTSPHESPRDRSYGDLYYYESYGKLYKSRVSVTQNMQALCKGEEFQPIEIRSKMKCFRYHGGHPYYIINPLNAEQLSEDPLIIQYYNVLTESLMEEMYTARGRMYLSTVYKHDVNDRTASLNSRSSAGSITSLEYAYKIGNLTSMLTGLIGMESTQAVEYVYGRVYWAHFDTFGVNYDEDDLKEDYDPDSDRVATVLYYVDVPVDGGNTPFCDCGVAAYPVRGSAVYWLNMFKNGTVRSDTSHGACPVLYSSKTILNQWISYGDNFRTFPCSLNQLE